MNQQEYYIGWSDKVPEENKKALKKLLYPVFILLPILAFTLVFFVKPYTNHKFELGQLKEFSGVYYNAPFPALILDEGQAPAGSDMRALLVGFGKFSATSIMQNIEKKMGSVAGKRIKVAGTLIYGDGKTVIELTKKEKSFIEILDENVQDSQPSEVKNVSLQGEILDSKCWFGVMKPGDGKVHKSCAIRCISGGVPPILRVRENGKGVYYLLQGTEGQAINKEVLQFVAETVSIQGETYEQNGWNVLKIDPSTIQYIN